MLTRHAMALFVVSVGILSASMSAATGASGQAGAPSSPPTGPRRALLDQYCVTCHNQTAKVGGLALDRLDLTSVGSQGPMLEKVVRKLRAGLMPPAGRPRPEQARIDELAASLEGELDRAAAARPNPGRTEAFHRLNRTEYRNVIRDLLALDVDVSELLPPDDVSYGFDNIAGALKINQTGMERYLSAARTVSRMAVGGVLSPTSETFSLSVEQPQYDHVEGLPFGTRGGTLIQYMFPRDGEYRFNVTLVCPNTLGGDENCDGAGGFPEEHQMEVLIDGERAHVFTLRSRTRRERYVGEGQKLPGLQAKDERWETRFAVTAGPHDVGVTFVRTPPVEAVQDGFRMPFAKPFTYIPMGMEIQVPHVSRVTIAGPFGAAAAGDTPSRRAIFSCDANDPVCAKTILSRLTRRAYRRPVTDTDVQKLLAFYDRGRQEGGGELGIQRALEALLVSPEFWYRIAREPAGVAANQPYRISDLELASRLSFFIWSSIPDERLLDVASRGGLKDPRVLEREVRRMLADPRSGTLTTNFAAQWLHLRDLAAVKPNPLLFPDYDDSLRHAMQRETELFIDSIVREDRSVLDLLNADYTFVNDRLAQHYGLPGVGSDFTRVTLPSDSPRRGLLGQGSILVITSHAVRTSPVKRGKWIMENILGTPPPPPPPNVPPFPEKKPGEAVLTVRQRMAQHRANPVCATCHATIDPLGFALENFDPVGQERSVEQDTWAAIDASGVLPDGTKFSGLSEFQAILRRRPERFVTTLTEKLLTYAMGRGVEYYDMAAIRRVLRDSAPRNYRFSSLIVGIAKSDPFQMRTAEGGTQHARQ